MARVESASSFLSLPVDIDPDEGLEHDEFAYEAEVLELAPKEPTPVTAVADTAAVTKPVSASMAAVATVATVSYNSHTTNPTIGNAGFYYANFGQRSKHRSTQAVIDAQLKRNPHHMMFLSEMPEETACILRLPPRLGEQCPIPNEAVVEFYKRPEREWVTCRQDDEHGDPCCIAVRKDCTVPPHLTELQSEVLADGWDKKNRSSEKRMCYTRIVVCRAHFSEKMSIGHMGKDVVGMAMHLHHNTAKKAQGFANAHATNFDIAANMARHHGVRVLAMDANMSLCLVPGEFRSRGISCVTVAWYPYRSGLTKMAPYMDSCGIFFLNMMPMESKLEYPLTFIKDGDTEDFWQRDENADDSTRNIPYWPCTAGPGKAMKCYLPKGHTLQQKLRALLGTAWPTWPQKVQASIAVAAAKNSTTAVAVDGSRPFAVARKWLKTKEKGLDGHVWAQGGEYTVHGGSHYPLAVFTDNEGRYSETGWKHRQGKKHDRQKLKGRWY